MTQNGPRSTLNAERKTQNAAPDSRWLRLAEGLVVKGPRLRTRGFIPFAALVLWLATRGPLNYWGLGIAAAGELLRLWASGHLHKGGPSITTSGPYAFCRNPLYLGSLLLGLGFSLAVKSLWLAGIVAVLLLVFHWITIAREERRLEGRYGQPYVEYCRRVPRLWPNPFRKRGQELFSLRTSDSGHRTTKMVPVPFFTRLLANREHWRALALAVFAAALVLLSLGKG